MEKEIEGRSVPGQHLEDVSNRIGEERKTRKHTLENIPDIPADAFEKTGKEYQINKHKRLINEARERFKDKWGDVNKRKLDDEEEEEYTRDQEERDLEVEKLEKELEKYIPKGTPSYAVVPPQNKKRISLEPVQASPPPKTPKMHQKQRKLFITQSPAKKRQQEQAPEALPTKKAKSVTPKLSYNVVPPKSKETLIPQEEENDSDFPDDPWGTVADADPIELEQQFKQQIDELQEDPEPEEKKQKSATKQLIDVIYQDAPPAIPTGKSHKFVISAEQRQRIQQSMMAASKQEDEDGEKDPEPATPGQDQPPDSDEEEDDEEMGQGDQGASAENNQNPQ